MLASVPFLEPAGQAGIRIVRLAMLVGEIGQRCTQPGGSGRGATPRSASHSIIHNRW
jgi:hypothetical protein